jgi:hypothetical protein
MNFVYFILLAALIPSVVLKEKSDKLDKFIQEALDEHNELRAKHGASPLRINAKLSALAQRIAEKYAKNPSAKPRVPSFKGSKVGRNYGFWRGASPYTGKDMTKLIFCAYEIYLDCHVYFRLIRRHDNTAVV